MKENFVASTEKVERMNERLNMLERLNRSLRCISRVDGYINDTIRCLVFTFTLIRSALVLTMEEKIHIFL